MNDQIKEMLDRLSELDDTGLATLEGHILTAFSELENTEPTPQSVEGMTSLADALDSVRSELTRRTRQEAELKSKAEEIAKRVNEPQVSETADEDVPVAEEEEVIEVEVDPAQEDPDADGDPDSPETTEEEDEEGKKKHGAMSTEADAEPSASSELTADNADDDDEPAETTDEPVDEEVDELGSDDEVFEEKAEDDDSDPQELETEAVENSELSTTEETPKEENAMTASSESHGDVIVPPADAAPVSREVKEGLGLTITAGADIPGYGAGQQLTDLNQVADAFAKRLHTLSSVMGNEGQRYNVASLAYQYPESRRLGRDDSTNFANINKVIGEQAITAAAGVCAPLETIYDINVCGDADRPIRDALARFSADRGGVRIFGAPTLPTDAVGIWDPKAPAAKTCADADCPTPEEIMLEAVYACVCFSNFTNRFFPEAVKANTDLAMINHARQAELALLKKIKDASTDVTADDSKAGITRQIIRALSNAASLLRRKYRLSTVAPMRAILPSWVLDAMAADLAQQMPGDGLEVLSLAASRIEALLAARDINVTWSLDSWDNAGADKPPTGTNGWDTTVSFPLFPEGSFLFLDGGTLDLGVTRDKALVQANEYCTFVETFENVAKTGCESLWITTPVCVSGAAAALVETIC